MKPFRSLVLLFLFWMLLFAFQRGIFLLYYRPLILFAEIPFPEIINTFISAIPLDISTASYLMVLPFLLLLIQQITNARWLDHVFRYYVLLVLMIYLLISSGELGLYGEWNTKLSFRALTYLRNPGEVMNSISLPSLALLLGLVIGQTFLFYYLFKKLFFVPYGNFGKRKWPAILVFGLLTPALLVVSIRGGLGQIPITTSKSYFSKYNVLNVAAVNHGFNLGYSMLDYLTIDQQNHFHFMPDEEAGAIVENLHMVSKDTTISILNMERPSILIIMLESWSANVIASLSGDEGIAPEFGKLEKEGLLFTEFYASGTRSQQALAGLFGGYPSPPITTLTDNPQKYYAIPSMVHLLNANDYYSAFYFGGDLNYGNIHSYLIYNEFDRIIGHHDFRNGQPEGRLGYHDEVLFERLAKDIPGTPEPFFITALTLSSHSPYDYPGERPIKGYELQLDYLNSVHYTDRQLGIFFDKIKQTEWYKNALVIIMADHSHMSHKNDQHWNFSFRRIPLLIHGGALKDSFKGKSINRIFGNMDLTATLLKQLNLPDHDFYWSKNMFNPYSSEFAFFELNYGFGWKRPSGQIERNIVTDYDFYNSFPQDSALYYRQEGEAYVQYLLKAFLSY